MMSERRSLRRYQPRLRDLLIVTALVALPLGFFAPELRSWDKSTRVIFGAVGAISVLAFVSFWPVWVVLIRLRRRSYQGLPVTAAHHVLVAGSCVVSRGFIYALLWGIKWLVVG